MFILHPGGYIHSWGKNKGKKKKLIDIMNNKMKRERKIECLFRAVMR